MEKHLLLPSSTPSKNSSLISEIYQSIIDLQWDPPENEIQTLLKDSISFLDKDNDVKTTKEIINLIFECFSRIKNKKEDIIKEICDNSKKNSNRLILFALLCSKNEKEMNNPQIKTIISDILKQILKHIKSKERKLIIYNFEINQLFKLDFIYNIILRAKTSEKAITIYYSYILSHINISKEKSDKLFQRAINTNLITSFSEDILADERYFEKFSKDNIISMLPKITAKTFVKILILIQKTFSIKENWSIDFFNSIFEKCVEFNVDFKNIQIPFFFDFLDPKSMKKSYWIYFSQNEVSLPNKFIESIDEGLLEVNDTFLFNRLLDDDFKFDGKESKIFSDKNFWIHIFNVFSSSKEKYTKPLYKPFVDIFEKFVDIEKSYEYIEAMIFSKFPTTETGNQFLFDFLNELNSEYKETFNQKTENLLTHIFDLNIFPLPSFWDIFDYEFIVKYFENVEKIDGFIMSYAYFYIISKSHLKTIDNLSINPYTNESSVIEFIKRNDLNYIVNMNNDSLFIIISALIYTEQEVKPKIDGLTKITILPFLAITFNFFSKKNDNNLPLSVLYLKKMSNLLIDACKYLTFADNPLMNESINSILTHFDCLLQHFNEDAIEMIEILLDQLIDDVYKADEAILLKTIFEMQKIYSFNEKVQLFFEKYRISLINCILKIKDFSKLPYIKLDLKIFNIKKVSTILIKSIQNTKNYNEFINAVYIIINSNIGIPEIEKVAKKINLISVFQKAISRKKIYDLATLTEFNYRYKKSIFNQDYYVNMNISNFQNFAFEFFFNFFISKSNIISNYLEALFEKNCVDFEVKAKTILEKYFVEYNQYKNDFIDTLFENFVYNSHYKTFVKLPVCSDEKKDNYNDLILSVLFKEAEKQTNDYEIFLILYKLISAFPFLFSNNNIKNFFNAVLPALDNFDLYFTIDNSKDVNTNLLKRSISAFYCLYSSLYSPKILDSFVPWLFKNILFFTPKQTFSMLYILISLFTTLIVRDGMYAFSDKMGYSKILFELSKLEIPEEISSYYKENVFELINLYFNGYLATQEQENAYIKGLKLNSSPFSSIFNHFLTIYPMKLSPLKLPNVKNDEIKKFIENFNKPQNFSFHYDRPSIEISEEQFDEFINQCNQYYDTDNSFSSVSYHKSYPTSTEMTNCSSKFDNWIFRSFFDSDFELEKSPKHIKILGEAKYIIDYFSHPHLDLVTSSESIFGNYKLMYYIINDTQYSPLVNRMIRNAKGIDLFCGSIKRYCYYSENYSQIKDYFVNIYNDDSFYNSSEFNDAIITFSLLPEMRKDIQFLLMASKANINYHSNHYPKNIDYFVSLLLCYNDESLNESAFELIDKIEKLKILPSLEKSIKHFFDIELAKRNPSAIKLIKYIKIIPSLLKSCREKIPLMINTLMFGYKQQQLENKSGLIRAIYLLFNEISPERKEDDYVYNINDENTPIDFSLSASVINVNLKNGEKKDGLLQKVPDHLIKSNPTFWNLYIKHRDTLNEIVNENTEYYSNFKFLKDYPELMSFENRLDLFRKSIRKVNKYNSTDLYVSRSRVLVDSFNDLRRLSRDEWLNIFNVHFRNENGIDAGGLTKDWFSLITKEIFNPNFALFVLTENQTYQPNPFSGVNSQHIEYFNFIGKVIARALIQGQYVKCHFARSFIRQILRLPLKLKDFEDYDTNIYNSMLLILKEDVEPLCLTFTIDVDEFGETKTVLLKEKGDEIDVNNENKKEYVSLYTNYKLRKSIINQINAFCEGFYFLIPFKDIKIFSPSELDLMICGIPDIDVDDLRANTKYCDPYYDDHPVIEMFFSAISKWNREDLAKFLLFVTGSSQVPINGFKEYCDKGKPITISPGGSKERFCVAHTCFNTLDLPFYESEEELNRKLLISIQELEFGIA